MTTEPVQQIDVLHLLWNKLPTIAEYFFIYQWIKNKKIVPKLYREGNLAENRMGKQKTCTRRPCRKHSSGIEFTLDHIAPGSRTNDLHMNTSMAEKSTGTCTSRVYYMDLSMHMAN